MTNEQIKDQLREIVNTPARQITEEQKQTVLDIAQQIGLNVKPRKNCGSCYHDAAMQILGRIVETEEPESEKATDDGRKYILKKGIDLLFGTIRVNELTLTDDMARYIISRGFEKKYFAKCE